MALGVGVEVIRKKAFNKFNFDSAKFVKEACQIIKLDIQDGMDKGKDIDDVPFTPLRASTIERKKNPHFISFPKELATPAFKKLNSVQKKSMSKGLSSFNSKRKGGMTKGGTSALNSQQARYISQRPNSPLLDGGNLWRNQLIETTENEGTIRIGNQRADVAAIQQIQAKRKFFGISVRAVDKIRLLLQKRWGGAFEISGR